MRLAFALSFAALVVAAPAIAESPEHEVVGHIKQQLACRSDPDAVPLLTYLSQRGYISLSETKKSDSTSCWRLHRPLDMDGIAIQGVCAANEDPFMRAMYPNIFWRGPGTSAGTLLSVVTSLSVTATKSWANQHGIDSHDVDKSFDFSGLTKIECNSLNRRDNGPTNE